jgi:hypothetical protein
MGRWDVLIGRLFDDWDREIAERGTLSHIKAKILNARAEAAREHFQKDPTERMSRRIHDFTVDLRHALERRFKDVSYDLMLKQIKRFL